MREKYSILRERMAGEAHLVWDGWEDFPRKVMLSWERKEERNEPGECRDGKNVPDRVNIMCKGPEAGRHRDLWRRERKQRWLECHRGTRWGQGGYKMAPRWGHRGTRWGLVVQDFVGQGKDQSLYLKALILCPSAPLLCLGYFC